MAKSKGKDKREASAEEQPPAKAAKGGDGEKKAVFRNKEKVLILTTRGITHR